MNDLEWTWACFADLAAGCVFAAELLLGFHVTYLASNGGQQREVRGGRAVARYYVRHGSFWQDALSTAIWVTQVRLCWAGLGWAGRPVRLCCLLAGSPSGPAASLRIQLCSAACPRPRLRP